VCSTLTVLRSLVSTYQIIAIVGSDKGHYVVSVSQVLNLHRRSFSFPASLGA